MPDFIVIGAVKAGTTSLYHYLGQHPEIRMSRENWPRFFHVEGGEPDFDRLEATYGKALLAESQRRYRLMCHPGVPRTLEAYEAMWPAEDRPRLRGEVSPTYLHDAAVPERVRRRFPDVRLIAVLRQPAARAYSHYVMDVTKGWLPRENFADTLKREPVGVDEFWWGLRHCYRHGLYARSVARWIEIFGPRQMKICLYDDLAANPGQFVRDLFDFIGVDPDGAVDVRSRYNQSLMPAPGPGKGEGEGGPATFVKAPPLQAEAHRLLTDLFRPEIMRLQELIGRDLSVWLA